MERNYVSYIELFRRVWGGENEPKPGRKASQSMKVFQKENKNVTSNKICFRQDNRSARRHLQAVTNTEECFCQSSQRWALKGRQSSGKSRPRQQRRSSKHDENGKQKKSDQTGT